MTQHFTTPSYTPPPATAPAAHIPGYSYQPASDPEPPSRQQGRFRLYPRTLATRLTFGAVALVLIIVAAVGSATYLSLRSFLIDRLDQQLQSIASGTAIPVVHCVSLSTCTGISTHNGPYVRSQQQWLALYAPDGSFVSLDSYIDPDSDLTTIAETQQLDVVAQNPGRFYGMTVNRQSIRVEAVQVGGQPGNEQSWTVISGISTSELDRTLHRLIWVELTIGLGALAIASMITAYGVRLSLRPLRNITRTAQTVAAELSPSGTGLDRRVPVGDPDTDVGQLATSMNTLLESVETEFGARLESEHRMRQFLADASHELRTPLVSIRGYAELARMQRQRGAEQSAAASADALDRIEGEGTRMSRLVDDLLVLARSDRGTVLHRDPVDVGDLIDDAVAGVQAAFPQRVITADAQPGLGLNGDHDQLLRVLRNLITNAAIHTDPAGPIHVRAFSEYSPNATPTVVLQVIDRGPGLLPEDAAQVFGRFWRADKARTRARGGSGLGLSIVASIVQAHGGSVSFDSSVDAGSTVTVRLPVHPPTPADVLAPAEHGTDDLL